MARRDAFVEDADYYRDTGCTVAPACLKCPLPRCRYDVPGGVRVMLNVVRDAQIREAFKDGKTINDIAKSFGVSSRTVRRVLDLRG